jgi:hypothetical protein
MQKRTLLRHLVFADFLGVTEMPPKMGDIDPKPFVSPPGHPWVQSFY